MEDLDWAGPNPGSCAVDALDAIGTVGGGDNIVCRGVDTPIGEALALVAGTGLSRSQRGAGRFGLGCTIARRVYTTGCGWFGTTNGEWHSAEAELTTWQSRLASGQTTFTQIAGGGQVFPGMFVWLVANARENLAQGFQRATEVYQNRAAYRSDVMLYAALPVAVIVLGTLICGQLYSMSLILARVISSIGM